MEINGTIIIQGLNFAIAYFLLKTLLFKPALRIINQEDTDRTKVIDTIEQYNKKIENKECELQQQLEQYQQACVKQAPAVEQERLFVFKDIAPRLSYPELSEQELKRFTDDVVPPLLAKVEHVRR